MHSLVRIRDTGEPSKNKGRGPTPFAVSGSAIRHDRDRQQSGVVFDWAEWHGVGMGSYSKSSVVRGVEGT